MFTSMGRGMAVAILGTWIAVCTTLFVGSNRWDKPYLARKLAVLLVMG